MEGVVEEIQGLYGPVQVTERFLQLLWKRQALEGKSGWETRDGCPIRVLDPGIWNHLEGPDFLDARVEFGGELRFGAIELHFHRRDWRKHGHGIDPNYDNVILHVLLFQPEADELPATNSRGATVPEWVMLPHLARDLESLVEEEAIREDCPREAWEAFQGLPQNEQEAALVEMSRSRWHQKVCRARYLLDELGWSEALHLQTLEVLGYSRNRSQMTSIARALPLAGLNDLQLTGDELFSMQDGLWNLAGIRPANHPLWRLRAYCRQCREFPEWPDVVHHWGQGLPESASHHPTLESTRDFRKQFDLPGRAACMKAEVMGDMLGGSRFHNWMVDAVLPLYSALGGTDHFKPWFHWFPGDAPFEVLRVEKAFRAQVPRRTRANGWIQGILGYTIRLNSGWVQLEFNDLPEGWAAGPCPAVGK